MTKLVDGLKNKTRTRVHSPPSPPMSLLGLVYPKQCVGCEKRGRYFCYTCLKSVKLRKDYICPECNKWSLGGRVHLGCKKLDSLEGLVSLLSYKGLVRRGVHGLKYQLVKEMEDELVGIFMETIKQQLKNRQAGELVRFLKTRPVVVAMPLHWRRENWRGFNQAEMVTKMVVDGLGLELLENWLVKVRSSKAQMKLKKDKREENVRGVFQVRGEKKVKRALLVDDVWTTGATMRAASRVLKRAGVKQVWGLTLAR